MAVDVVMPRLGLTMDEGTVMRWLAAEGDRIRKGQPILEVETDKVALEVEAPASGILGPVLVAEGETVPVTALLARILAEGEAPERPAASAGSPPPAAIPTSPAGPAAAPEVARPGRPFSSPRARTLARLQRLDWKGLSGSGPGGRVVARDVAAAVQARNENRPAPRRAQRQYPLDG